MPFFDTHAHLDNEQLAPQITELVEKAEAADVVGMTAIGTTVQSSQACVKLSNQFENVFAAVGIHPNNCAEASENDWQQILNLVDENENVVAIGETGLDRYWDDCPIEVQKKWFSHHIELSFESQRPLVVHMRDCEADILEVLSDHLRENQVIGIMHSFAGSWQTAKQCLEWGMYISFAGMVTFKKSTDLREIAGKIPAHRLLIETDSPYLSPHPFRHVRPNHPAMVQHTAQCVADARGVSVEHLGELTTNNARKVFRLS